MNAMAALPGYSVGHPERRITQRERCRQTNSTNPQAMQAGMTRILKKWTLNRMVRRSQAPSVKWHEVIRPR
jgi:hypothetical protein